MGIIVLAGEPRLLRDLARRETWDEYRRAVGDAEPLHGAALVAALDAAGLRGRGGAGFPAAHKWRTVADAPGPRVVVANGEEGESFSFKDRYLLRRRPHTVLDGALLAAEAVGASQIVVYLSDPEAERSVRAAISERADAASVDVFRVPHTYVAGEESAVVRAINGGPPLPTEKPPRPFEQGVGGRPTLLSNVETLGQAAWIARQPDASRRVAPPPFLATIGGACSAGGLYELPSGERLGAILERAGADLSTARGVVMGGYFAGLLNRRAWALPLDYETLRAEGSGIGCAALLVLGAEHCAVAAAAVALRFFAGASSRQCGTCLNGTEAMARAAERLVSGSPAPDDVERLARWATTLRGGGACALLDGAAQMAGAFLRDFPDDVATHAAGAHCVRCAVGDHDALFAPLDDLPPVHPPFDMEV